MNHPNSTPDFGQPDILTAALEYLRRGLSVIPIAGKTKKPPRRFRWKKYQKTLPTEDDLRLWFDGRDDLGLAVILGAVSGGLVCRDFDTMESYDRWAADHPDLASLLPTVATARARHVYCRAPPAYHVFRDLGDGEFRGAIGHYCVLPPSPPQAFAPSVAAPEGLR